VLFNILKSWGVKLTKAMADALYVGISTDTGSFQYGSTTPAVMHAAGELLAAGVDVADVNRRVYQEVPYTALLMQREVLNHMVVECGGMLAHYSMPAGRKAELGVGLEDTKDLVDVVRVLQGVKVAVIFEDLDDGRVRMSLRSKDPAISVAAIAAQFGGGGHAMAAGIRMRGPLEVCREQVLNAIRKELSHE
jgi:phosphoesterase RecJ-like protein